MKSAWAAISAGFIAAVALGNPSQVTNAFQGLSRQERATLDQGKALIRQASSACSLSLAAPGDFGDEIRNRVRSLDANYISEVIMVVPAGAASSGFLQALAKDLAMSRATLEFPTSRSRITGRTICSTR